MTPQEMAKTAVLAAYRPASAAVGRRSAIDGGSGGTQGNVMMT